MKIGPKYKIARRLGAPVFEKTQTQKYALSESKKGQRRRSGRPRQISDYGLQLIEKQKARYYYCLSEKQFSRSVKEARGQQVKDPASALFESLEKRLDSTLIRAGFGPSRLFCRQLISHGHIMVNDRKVTIPSYKLQPGDKITIRPQSKDKGVFSTLSESLSGSRSASWIKINTKDLSIEVTGEPKKDETDLLFDLPTVLEFYSR